MEKKGDLSDSERGMVVGARRADLSISKTADLLGFSHTTISSLQRMVRKRENIRIRISRVRIWHKEHESMDPSCLVSTVQAAGGGGVMVLGIFSWHTLGLLEPIEHRLSVTAYPSIVADHVHPFMTTVYPSSDATSSSIMHHVTKLKSSQTGFLNMTLSSLYSNGLHSHQISIQ